ncbi:MAG: IS630 family transposase [Gemmatimonadaceae bacterium]
MAPVKNNAARLGAHLVFVDESGFLLIPTVRRTWAPCGHTPRRRHWQRHDRVSIISGLSLSPTRRRCGLYFQLHRDNIRAPDAGAFLRYLLRHLRGNVLVLWDNSNIHRGPVIRATLARYPRLRVAYFPPYAPELNPDEGVWARTKAELANGRPDDVLTLLRTLIASLTRLKRSPRHLRACIAHADVPMHLP